MYNLFVSGNDEAWHGEPWTIEESRCVREYTDEEVSARYGSLDTNSVAKLSQLPCVFAYEAYNGVDPKFGLISDVTKRQGLVRINYEVIDVDPFLTAEDIIENMFELDIGKWEMNRTHWAVKEVNLAKELSALGIQLPSWAQRLPRAINLETHQFEVALSFPGEARSFVEKVAGHLERLVGPDSYFYDNNYTAQLARPSLDVLLQEIYRERAKLIVVFLSADYQRKDWCGIEFRAIRDLISERDHKRIMFVRTDDGAVDGVFKTDGYVDGRTHDPGAIAQYISERLAIL